MNLNNVPLQVQNQIKMQEQRLNEAEKQLKNQQDESQSMEKVVNEIKKKIEDLEK